MRWYTKQLTYTEYLCTAEHPKWRETRLKQIVWYGPIICSLRSLMGGHLYKGPLGGLLEFITTLLPHTHHSKLRSPQEKLSNQRHGVQGTISTGSDVLLESPPLLVCHSIFTLHMLLLLEYSVMINI
jgi:hypothetical protein